MSGPPVFGPFELWILARWVARDVWRALLLYLLPRWFALALVLVEADAIVDTNELRAQLTAAPSAAAGGFVFLLSALLALSQRQMVTELLLGSRHAVLRRQPLPGWSWGPASLVVLLPQGLPLGVFAAFWYGPTALPSVLGWTLCCALPAVLIARGGLRYTLLGLLASGGAGLLAMAGHLGFPLLSVVVGIATLPLVGQLIERAPSVLEGDPWSASPRLRGPVTALLHRDLLAIVRRERVLLWSALSAAPLVGCVARAAWVNGQYEPAVLVRFPLTAMLLQGPLALAMIAAAARHTGRSFDPPHWPVSVPQRVLTLTVLGLLVFVPSWALAAVAAPPLAVAGNLRIGVFVLLAAVGAAFWVARAPSRPNAGSFLYWLLACLFAAIWRQGPLLGALLGIFAWSGAVRALKRRRQGR